uniref:Uncharacterized protein n=1 Tax=viral metagenome TaxID=1070528 RepID=A0A6M3JFW2_9ZZZZ
MALSDNHYSESREDWVRRMGFKPMPEIEEEEIQDNTDEDTDMEAVK